MADGTYEWGFYGRQAELEELSSWMASPRFAPMAVIGGRGVGKSKLIEQAAESLHGRRPVVNLELPTVESTATRIQHEGKIWNVCKDLAIEAREQGLSDALPSPESLHHVGQMISYFKYGCEALLRRKAIVVLDEFQHATNLTLVDGVKQIIDRANNRPGSGASGNLLVAGSHQQKILKVLRGPDESMFQRIDHCFRLSPLRAAGVLEMAADQGWLDRPNRLLTAYAALGGSPRLWRRMARDQARGLLPEPAGGSDEAWRLRFVARQAERFRSDQTESHFHSDYVDFSEDARIVAQQLSGHPEGVRWSQVVQTLDGSPQDAEDRARRGFEILRSHLKIAESIPVRAPNGSPSRKVRLTEPAALFELTAARIMERNLDGRPEDAAKLLLAEIGNQEGFALERLAKEWLEAFPNMFGKARRSAEMTRPDGRSLEIDIVAEPSDYADGERWLALCSCKRSAGRHKLKRTREDFDLYLRLRAEQGEGPERSAVRRCLFSPSWPPDIPRNDGFVRFGLTEMARLLEYEPRPWPSPPRLKPQPETSSGPSAGLKEVLHRAPEPDGPSFDM